MAAEPIGERQVSERRWVILKKSIRIDKEYQGIDYSLYDEIVDMIGPVVPNRVCNLLEGQLDISIAESPGIHLGSRPDDDPRRGHTPEFFAAQQRVIIPFCAPFQLHN
jgi:hypothetical protein